MKITWFGQSCFLLETHTISIVTDPYDSQIGLKLPTDLHADIVTVSHQHMDHNNTAAVIGEPKIISDTGTITIKEVVCEGITSFHDDEQGKKRGQNIIFKFSLEGINIAHLGDLGHMLTDTQLSLLGHVDILLIPVGGSYTIDGVVAAAIVQQLQPTITIPMHYGITGLGFPLEPVESFTKNVSLPVRTQNTLEITKDSLPKKAEIVVLQPAIQ